MGSPVQGVTDPPSSIERGGEADGDIPRDNRRILRVCRPDYRVDPAQPEITGIR
jgi:hypothetical protein